MASRLNGRCIKMSNFRLRKMVNIQNWKKKTNNKKESEEYTEKKINANYYLE